MNAAQLRNLLAPTATMRKPAWFIMAQVRDAKR